MKTIEEWNEDYLCLALYKRRKPMGGVALLKEEVFMNGSDSPAQLQYSLWFSTALVGEFLGNRAGSLKISVTLWT